MTASSGIAMRGISKRFDRVQALVGVDFSLRRREVHALVGENGAGKTTLMNVLAGLCQPDAGKIVMDGRPVRISSPRRALELGIGMVHQHFELVPAFTALENIILGNEGRGLWLRQGQQRKLAEGLMQRYGIGVELDAPVRHLSIGVQQKVEILKVLFRGVELLILDEPTTHLTPQEVDGLFATIRRLVQGGLTVVLITHKLREILGIGDRITVMRRGRVVGTLDRAEADEDRLVELIIGRRGGVERNAAPPPPSRPPGEPILELDRASALGGDRRPAFQDCSFQVRAGEMLGVAGVAGNGQRELAEAIVGLRPLSAGRLRLRGRDISRSSARDRLLAGVAYVPEDRLREGILPHLSLAETFALGLHESILGRRWMLDERRMRSLAREAIKEYAIAVPNEQMPTAKLSGGNIQKVLVARAMLLASRRSSGVLVAMNPTRGLDIGTTEFVHRRLLELRDRGGGVLLVSEDLDELMRFSDRILVLYRGRITASFERADFDAYRIGSMMAGTAGDGGEMGMAAGDVEHGHGN